MYLPTYSREVCPSRVASRWPGLGLRTRTQTQGSASLFPASLSDFLDKLLVNRTVINLSKFSSHLFLNLDSQEGQEGQV